jgi:hypothetical protein
MRLLAACALIGALALTPVVTVEAQAPAPPASAADGKATPQNAAAFLGDWTLNGEGPMGAATVSLSLKVEKDVLKAVVAITAPEEVTDLERVGSTLVLRYNFDYEGNPIPVVLTLTPAADKVNFVMDFAGGAAQIAGVGAKTTK